MTEQRYVDDVREGEDLPVVAHCATRAQLFLYSAATWNPHRIHYDREYAAREGHPDVLVHGPLQGAWLTQYLTDWAGPRGRLVAAEWQNRASAFPDTDYEFRGRVVSVDRESGRVDIELCEQSTTGERLMPGRGTVVLPRREPA